MNPEDYSRRQMLKATLISAAGLVAGSKALASACGLTPAQTEGPFYPVKDQPDKDADLTVLNGATRHAKGQVVLITGTVTDTDCRPVAGALVEIWQACATGRYNHPGDSNPAALDPDFQYWGRATTDAKGRYRFRTIIPGHYPADTDWIRPPHIHYKVYARGYHELTTQMYFDPAAFDFDARVTPAFIRDLNRKDLILQAVAARERERVIVKFASTGAGKTGEFNITLQRVGR